MEINIIPLAIGICAPLIAAIIWQSPDMLRWVIARLAARMAYIEAGRQAYAAELKRHEVAA